MNWICEAEVPSRTVRAVNIRLTSVPQNKVHSFNISVVLSGFGPCWAKYVCQAAKEIKLKLDLSSPRA